MSSDVTLSGGNISNETLHNMLQSAGITGTLPPQADGTWDLNDLEKLFGLSPEQLAGIANHDGDGGSVSVDDLNAFFEQIAHGESAATNPLGISLSELKSLDGDGTTLSVADITKHAENVAGTSGKPKDTTNPNNLNIGPIDFSPLNNLPQELKNKIPYFFTPSNSDPIANMNALTQMLEPANAGKLTPEQKQAIQGVINQIVSKAGSNLTSGLSGATGGVIGLYESLLGQRGKNLAERMNVAKVLGQNLGLDPSDPTPPKANPDGSYDFPAPSGDSLNKAIEFLNNTGRKAPDGRPLGELLRPKDGKIHLTAQEYQALKDAYSDEGLGISMEKVQEETKALQNEQTNVSKLGAQILQTMQDIMNTLFSSWQ